MTPFSVLFLLNRYFALSATFSIFFLNATVAGDSCPLCKPGLTLAILSTVTVLVAEAILILRAHAVYQGNKIVIGLLLSVWTVHLALMIFILAGDASFVRSFGVALTFSQIPGLLFIVPAVVFDVVVGTLLTLGLYRKSGSFATKMPLIRLIIQDGLLYFAVVFVTNVAWIVIHIVEVNKPDTYAVEFTPMEIWSACITTVMIGRLTLNLRKYDPTANDELTFQIMSLRFRNSRHRTSTVSPLVD